MSEQSANMSKYVEFLEANKEKAWVHDESMARFVAADGRGIGTKAARVAYLASGMRERYLKKGRTRNGISRKESLKIVLARFSCEQLRNPRGCSLELVDELKWQYESARSAVSYARVAHGINRRRPGKRPYAEDIQRVIDDWRRQPQTAMTFESELDTSGKPEPAPQPLNGHTRKGGGSLQGVGVTGGIWTVTIGGVDYKTTESEAKRAALAIGQVVTVTFAMMATAIEVAG